jgi:WbqC-like protein family
MLLELPYWPPVAWLSLLWYSPATTLEACEHFQKGSYRNRCHIAGPNGLQRLSVPLLRGKHQQTPIGEVQIAYDQPWQRLHWRSIEAAYGNAPYFEHYAADLRLFYESPFPRLFDYNRAILDFLLQKMNYRGEVRHSSAFVPPAEPRHPNDWRDANQPGIPLPEWFTPRPYAQVFAERHGFQPNLSALDLLLCCGPQAGNFLSLLQIAD